MALVRRATEFRISCSKETGLSLSIVGVRAQTSSGQLKRMKHLSYRSQAKDLYDDVSGVEMELEKSQTPLTEIASLSFAMSLLFGFSQVTGFIARIVFKQNLTADQYGIFAFFINLFPFFVTLNAFSLHVPIISIISTRPSDDNLYHAIQAQIFTSSLITGIPLSALFFLWTYWTTSSLQLSTFFAVMVVVYSTSQVLHCLPRGRDQLRPAAVSVLIVGIVRIALLFLFLFVWAGDLFGAILVYTLPVLGWWVSFLFHEGVPSLSRPRLKDVIPLYKDAAFSSLYLLANQLPIVLGMAFLIYFHGFGVAGDFDIAMIPYAGLIVAFSGISFVMISKARKLPAFHKTMEKLASRVILPLVVVFALIAVLAVQLENPARDLVSLLGIQGPAYWAAVILVVVGVPAAIILAMLVSYLQGRGVIRPVGIIAILCAIGSFPLQYLLIMVFSINGAALAIALANVLIVVLLVMFGYRKLDPLENLQNQNDGLDKMSDS